MTNPANIPALAHAAHPVVQIENGQAITLSTEVARVFDKRHDAVLRDIQNLRKTLPADHLHSFVETVITRPNPSGGEPIKSPAYFLTRDGFTLLAFGFTGKKAMAFKCAFLKEFNRMEAELAARPDHIADASKMVEQPRQMEINMAQPVTPALVNELVNNAAEGILERLEKQCVLIHWQQVITAVKHESTDMSFADLTDLAHACLKRLQRRIDAEAYRTIERRATNRNQTTADVAINA